MFKSVQSPPRGEREHYFFKRIFSSNEHILNDDEKELKMLLPTYRGSFIHNESITENILKINKMWGYFNHILNN